MKDLSTSTSDIHKSVLLKESEEILQISYIDKYIDATLGLGGHTNCFCKKNKNLKVLGFDQDEFAREKAKERLKEVNLTSP